MVDRCAGWGAAKHIPDRSQMTLVQAMEDIWFSIHGPPKELVTDGEAGIVQSKSTNAYLSRKGITLHPRGMGQRATYAERRGSFLRETVNKIITQLHVENITRLP